jgi:hypothetical protein
MAVTGLVIGLVRGLAPGLGPTMQAVDSMRSSTQELHPQWQARIGWVQLALYQIGK